MTASWYKAARQEGLLLSLSGVFLALNFLALALLRQAALAHWAHWFVWALCAVVGTLALNRWLPRRDGLLFPLAMLLAGWGLLLQDRLLPAFADRQSLWLLISVAAMLLTACAPQVLRWLRDYRYLWLIFGIVLLLSTILLGRNPSGLAGAPELWLGLGQVFFQPSELLKVILVAFLASYLAEHYLGLRFAPNQARWRWLSPRILGPILLMWGLCVVILVWQRDLGTAVLFFAAFLVLVYAASGRWWVLFSGLALIGVASMLAYRLFAVVRLRVDIWLNPWLEADGRAFQIVQSLMAFGAGGIFGQGIGQGSPYYIPVVHSDFALSALAEEWGLLGVCVLVAVLAVLILRGLLVAAHHGERPFYALLAIGLTTLIGAQSLLIIGGVLKVLPLTGVTLPFLSYGGSSLLMSFIIIGLLLRLSAEAR